MADSPRIKFRRGLTSGVVPTGLLEGEIAINLADRFLYAGTTNGTSVLISGGGAGTPGPAGATGATGATGPQGNTGPVGDYVQSINGLTGIVTSVAFTNVGQTFSAVQNFSDVVNFGTDIKLAGGQLVSTVVTHINNTSGAINLVGGSGVSLSQSGNTFTFAITGTVSGATGATGATGPQGNTGPVGNYVESLNGATGVIVNVAKTDEQNTFSQTQFFTATPGFSADYVNINSIFSTTQILTIGADSINEFSKITLDGTEDDERIILDAGNNKFIKLSNVDDRIEISSVLDTIKIDGDDVTITAAPSISGLSSGTMSLNSRVLNVVGSNGVNFDSSSPGGYFYFETSGGIDFISSGSVTFSNNISAPNILYSLNGITGTVNITGGTDISVIKSGNTLTVSHNGLDGISNERFTENLQTGLLYGGILSINAGNTQTFDVSAGLGVIVNVNGTTQSAPDPIISYVSWGNLTGVTLANLASQETTWISINSSGNIVQSPSVWSDSSYRTQIPLGALVHPTKTYITLAKTFPHIAYSQADQTDPFVRAFGPLKLSGHTISANGANLQINRSSGTAYAMGRNWINDPSSPNVVTDSAATPATSIFRYYRDGSGGYTTVINSAVDPTKYDDGSGTLQTVPGGQYTVQRVYYFPGQTASLGVYYGTDTHTSLDQAQAHLFFDDASENNNTATQAILAGWLIVKSGSTDLSNTNDARFIQAGLFRNTASVGGSGLVIANLDDLADVTISSAANNQILVYDSSSSRWINSAASRVAVTSFNGNTGDVQGVSAAVAGTGISVSGATGSVTFTNTGVLSFNGSTGAIQGVSSVNGATGAVANVAKTNIAQTFTGLQQFASGISTTGITIDAAGKIVLENINSHTEYDAGGGLVDGGNVTFNADGQLSFFAGNGTGARLSDPIIAFVNANAEANADINLTTNGGDINLNSAVDINLTAGGGIIINPVSFVNIAGGVLYVDDTNNRVGVNVSTTPLFPLDVSGIANLRSGISAASGITFANTLQVGQTATFVGNISAPNIVNSVNGATGAINLAAGTNVTITQSGNTFTIASSGGGGGTPAGSEGYIQYYSAGGFSADNGLLFTAATETLQIGSGSKPMTIYPSASGGIVEVPGNSSTTLHVLAGTSGAGELTLAGTIKFRSPDGTSTNTFPSGYGSDGQVLTTNGAGTVDWVKPVPDFILMNMGII